MSRMKGHKGWLVIIPANIYTGKWYDYQTVAVRVEGIATEDGARQYVDQNREEVLERIDQMRVRVGDRNVRKVKRPVCDNVFFKKDWTEYRVKPQTVYRVESQTKVRVT